jgi:hypothetical protein
LTAVPTLVVVASTVLATVEYALSGATKSPAEAGLCCATPGA